MNSKVLLYIFLFSLFTAFTPLTSQGAEGGFHFNRNRRSVNIPIKVRNNLAVMPLYINDQGPFYFILDSGVNTTILTEPMLAFILDLQFERNMLIYGLGGEGIVEASLATDVKLSTRGITGKNKNLLVIPEDILNFSEVFGFPVYGIIGHDFLKHFPVRVSYASETLRVYRSSNYRAGRRSDVIPIQLINGKPYIESTIIGENGDTLTTNLLFDLGASHPIYLNKEHIALSDFTINGFLGKGVSGNLLGMKGRVKKVVIGKTEIYNPVVSYPEKKFLEFHGQTIEWEGLIGGGIIKRYNVIVDYPSEVLILRRSTFFSGPFHTNLSGIEVIARGKNMREFVVHYVRPGSAGYEAGILAGDKIVEINNKSHRQITLDDILNTLSENEGRNISMGVMRDNKISRKHFRLREDLKIRD